MSEASGGSATSAEEYVDRLRSVGDALVAPTAVLSPDDGSLLYANRPLIELLGIGGQSASLAAQFEDGQRFRQMLRDASHEQASTAEFTTADEGGANRIVEVWLRAVAGITSPGAVLMTLRDVTAERQLAIGRAELARFPDMNPGPVIRLSLSGAIVLANEAARTIFGRSSLVGLSWSEFCPAMHATAWRDLVEGDGDQSIEVEIDGRTFAFAHVVDRVSESVFAFGSDITAIRQAEHVMAEQARRLQEVARFPDMNPGPVLQLDEHTTVLLANRAALEVFGDDLVGRTWVETCPDFKTSDWERVVASDEFVTVERQVGDRRYVFYHRCDVASGRVFVYGADVTEQRRADELIRLLLASTGEGIYGVDPAGLCTFANPAAVRILGFETDADLLGRHMHNLVHHTRADGTPYPPSECTIYLALSNGNGMHSEDEVMWRQDGTSFPAEFWSFPMELDGELVGSVVTFVDITERRQIQDELASSKVAAEAASEAKSQFLANMSHELRTPMNAIIGYSAMLLEDAELDGDEEAAADLQKIQSAAGHLLDLINAVLDLSKVEAGEMQLNIEEFDVARITGDVVAVTQPLVEKNGNRLDVELDGTLGTMLSDTTKVRQCLLNLISNAAKFTHEGVITLRAARDRRPEGDRIVWSVADTGMGIPEDKLEHVFEEFAQASSTIARDYGGTGLGLPLTRRFCELLGGELRLESELGRGSTFTMELPERATAADVEPDDDVIGDGLIGTTADRSGGQRPDLLVIDDDPHARELLVRALEREGYAVITAADGKTGLELARSLSPAMITLDILMPSMDGWAVLTALKSDPTTADIPVAMLSIAPDHDLGMILGAVASLTKPIERAALYDLVKRYVLQPGSLVLIVDDDAASRALMRRYGEAAGWECAEAENGAIALQLIEQRRPDLILLDLMMPVMDGFTMLDELRADAGFRTIPVLVLTAKNLTAEDRARLNGNVERIIEKGQHTTENILNHLRSVLTDQAVE